MQTVSFKEFLERIPPATVCAVTNIAREEVTGRGASFYPLTLPTLELHCETAVHCAGVRLFEPHNENEYGLHASPGKRKDIFATYRCCNCSQTFKIYALAVCCEKKPGAALSGQVYKYGELPPFGPPTPARLLRILGSEEKDYYLKGRRAENQGMGVGAFAYYRRVVENQKNRLFDEIIRVARQIGASPEMLDDLNDAKSQIQFSTAVAAVKHGIPSSLLLDGHNPLTLLHTALSKGLHAQTDEECLALATSIRVVLADLSDRLGHALKERAELSAAVSRLMK